MPDAPWLITYREMQEYPADTFALIDVRSRLAFALSHRRGAARLSWLKFRDGVGRTGKLTARLPALVDELARRGIRHDRPTIVSGDGRLGWGEDGRIAWMLRYLGYRDVRVLDGEWTDERPIHDGTSGMHAQPYDVVHETPELVVRDELRADIDAVQRAIDERTGSARDTLLLDSRSLAEFNGSRRYLPARTGRIPGAVHLEWRSLLDRRSRLDRSEAMLHRLAQRGIVPGRPIITYCVGGVRSAHTLVMLRALGFGDVRNYDGSWYEWAGDRSRLVERGGL